MADTIPPDTRAPGQAGHIADHNNISDVLTAQETHLAGLPSLLSWGTANLAAGTVTIPNGNVLPTSLIFLSRQSPSGTLGSLGIAQIIGGVSFTVTSSSNLETSQIAFLLLNT